MIKKEQQIAVAEWMGYVWYRAPQDKHFPDKKYRFLAHPQIQEYEGQIDIWKQRADGTERIIDSEPWKQAQGVDYVPNFPEDLNAMHSAWEHLPTAELRIAFHNYLTAIVRRRCINATEIDLRCVVENATAEERCEALCRTLWPNRWPSTNTPS